MRRTLETILLVEPDGASVKLRAFQITMPVNRLVERPRTTLGIRLPDRIWVCKEGERDDSGQCRIFREELPPVKEEKENPIYDELVIPKGSIKFGVDKQTFQKMAKKYGKK